MKNCHVCGGECVHEETKKHPISGDLEIVYSFKCGKKVRLMRHGNNWVPVELSRCGKGEPK